MKFEIINEPMLCWDGNEDNAVEYHVLAKELDAGLKYPFAVVDNDVNIIWFKHAKPIQSDKSRTIEDGLKYGDIIVNDCGECKVLGICDDVIFISHYDMFESLDSPYLLSELINLDFKLKNKSDIIELTFQDISEGKGVGIDPKLIIIKE